MGSAAKHVDLYSRASSIPSIIQIFGAPNSTPSSASPQLDEINANAHETFTLEEMRVLLLNYRKKNKDFLLARVTTPDPENNSVFYNFYYAAAEINRILFRYEPNRRLLHRMKVKNPLNNMYIIGQVFYYKISVDDIDRSIIDYFFNDKKETRNTRKAFSAVFRPKHDSSGEKERDATAKDTADLEQDSGREGGAGEKSLREIIENISRGQTSLPQNIDKNKKIRYSAKYFASDDDFLFKSEIREYFKKMALEPEDEFLYELDRTQNDFMALLDEDSTEEHEEVSDWRRIFSAHISLALSLLFVCLLIGSGPLMVFIFLPLAAFLFLSFVSSLVYVMCCRRSTFDSVAVNSVDEEI